MTWIPDLGKPRTASHWPRIGGSGRRVRLLFLALLCFPLIARAQAPAESDQQVRLNDLVHQGLDFYSRGYYADAVAAYKDALAIQPLPELHLNLSKAYYYAGEPRQACEQANLYLRDEPAAPPQTRAEAESWRRKVCVVQRPASQPVAPIQRTPRWLKWTMGSAGLLGIAAGATLLALHGWQSCPEAPRCAVQLDSLLPGALALGAGAALLGGSSVLFGLDLHAGRVEKVAMLQAGVRF